MEKPIYINDASVVAAVKSFYDAQQQTYFEQSNGSWISPISSQNTVLLDTLISENKNFQHLDRSVQLALLCSRSLKRVDKRTAVNIGSSRGATALWEKNYDRFRESGTAPTTSSPLTTLGNISSWVAQDLSLQGTAFSHSITCATASHSILNAIAWLQSGMTQSMIVGGSEAPLTDFTISQMKALRIYSRENDTIPCKALDVDKNHNSMILGEAAALFLLSRKSEKSLAKIVGYGSAIEQLNSATSVTESGESLQESMRQAIKDHKSEEIDVIITHAPGTIKGDLAEYRAIKAVFGKKHPHLCNNKWQLGHTLGASSALNLAMAIEMLQTETIFKVPFLKESFLNPRNEQRVPQRILINATGFGGNAVSLLVEK